ncbi:MAG: peptide deformylase [Armatimonadota bacterium]
MVARRILTVPGDEKKLRKKSKKIDNIDSIIRRTLDEMLQMIDSIGYGLAAPQIGILKRITVIQYKDKVFKLINPRIIKKSDDTVCDIEGCLSVPGLIGDVDRNFAVTVKAQDQTGKIVKIEAEGLLARIFQHEIDHLDGILYTDKAQNLREPRTVEEGEDAEI